MRCPALVAAFACVPALLAAQFRGGSVGATERVVSLTAGIGNDMGWLGVQGERYLAEERLSVFVGLGYTPRLDPGDPTGAAFALGLRGFTPGVKHRLFAEGSVSQLALEAPGRSLYGPGGQVGYQFVSTGGFTFMASVGVGYAPGVSRGVAAWVEQVGVAAGYTWRRATDQRRRVMHHRRRHADRSGTRRQYS